MPTAAPTASRKVTLLVSMRPSRRFTQLTGNERPHAQRGEINHRMHQIAESGAFGDAELSGLIEELDLADACAEPFRRHHHLRIDERTARTQPHALKQRAAKQANPMQVAQLHSEEQP